MQSNENLGALFGRKRGGESGVALQIGPIDEAKDPGIVDISVILLFDRTAREHGGDAEGNAHLGLQRVVKRSLGVAAGIAGGGFRERIETVAMSSE